ncbi:MAG: 5-formyltetrahydrofolate cyclo-ligase [Neisseria sp.]|nr:5-formyltetrahydrofolate cyclo-ligase [Neisseria sp.]
MDDKRLLRTALRRARKDLSPLERRTATQRINRCLKKNIRRGKNIAVYRAVGSELNLNDFIHSARRRGAQVFEPLIDRRSRRLWFIPWGQTAHRRTRKLRMERMSTVLLPLLGIDRAGFRLGQGGGYYDTSLAACRVHHPRRIGVGFACQCVAAVPREAHDQALDAFVCERHEWRF